MHRFVLQPTQVLDGRGIVLGKVDSSTKRKRRRRRPAPDLKVEPDMFSDACVSGLVEDWIVPALVEQFLRSKKVLPDLSGEEHN